ncbi:MAG TPA: hypothetical protein VJ201_05440, partial [Candidatus Babeliales bacterium]|nr:hypothetical protein [Candidatus Babeliales bacterium]
MLNIKYFFYFLSIILVFHQNLYADHFSDKKRKKLATTYVLDDKKFEKFLEDSFMSSPHPRKV